MKKNSFLSVKQVVSLCMALAVILCLFEGTPALAAESASAQPVQEKRVTTVGEKDSAYINGDTDLMNYDGKTANNILPTTPTGTMQAGKLPLSSAAVNAAANYTVIKGSALSPQSNVGAHYYAYSGYNNTYSEAFANIKLPTGFYNAGQRTGYIALGITGSVHGIDLGLCNTGSGWYPVSYDVNNLFRAFDAYTAPSTATNAVIVVKPVNTTTVHMYVQFLNSSGANVGLTFDRDISVASGNLVTSGGKIMCRYYRFASLVPNSGTADNQNDGTYMTGGQITNCQLYNGSSYVSWGISTARVTNAWKVSPSKISLSYTTYNDTFAIQHY